MSHVHSTNQIVQLFEQNNIQLAPGLADQEVDDVQSLFQFRFPPDLRHLLQTVLPVSERFYDWRLFLRDRNIMEARLDWPRDGILFDVEMSDFWVHTGLPDVPSWGPKPETLEEKFEIAKSHIATYPKLIPIYGHRYIPETPHETGNPVFSVHQTDIVYYGGFLANYFYNELERKYELPHEIKRIPFWSDCCDGMFCFGETDLPVDASGIINTRNEHIHHPIRKERS